VETEDLSRMLNSAEQLRQRLVDIDKSLKKGVFTVNSQNNLVSISMNYQQEVLDIFIDTSLLSPSKAGILKSSVVETINRAIKMARDKMIEETAKAINLLHIKE